MEVLANILTAFPLSVFFGLAAGFIAMSKPLKRVPIWAFTYFVAPFVVMGGIVACIAWVIGLVIDKQLVCNVAGWYICFVLLVGIPLTSYLAMSNKVIKQRRWQRRLEQGIPPCHPIQE